MFPDRNWVEDEPTEQELRDVLRYYFEQVHMLNADKNMSAGVRARKALLHVFHLCRQRRKEILEQKSEYKYHVHSSWKDIDE